MRLLLALIIAGAPLAATAAEFKAGQTLACASTEPNQKLFAVVGRVEPFGQSTAVSISLYDLARGAALPEIGHLPIDARALATSCQAQSDITLPLSDSFEGGYADWRRAVQAEGAGIFSVPVGEVGAMLRKQVGPRQSGAVS